MVERFGLSGDVQHVGSVSVAQQTWLWSWANESLPHAALGDSPGSLDGRPGRRPRHHRHKGQMD
ncbi:DUF6882 domain-containing protein [Streptomyces sp. NPDC059629]|uniref:DUF6882 domain-containing protein n=1 Tax=Streptomyces sp. NPDC059629 TaxID=3346889 RepID=UPI00369CEDF3